MLNSLPVELMLWTGFRSFRDSPFFVHRVVLLTELKNQIAVWTLFLPIIIHESASQNTVEQQHGNCPLLNYLSLKPQDL